MRVTTGSLAGFLLNILYHVTKHCAGFDSIQLIPDSKASTKSNTRFSN